MAANVGFYSTARGPNLSGVFQGIGAGLGRAFGPEAQSRDILADPASYQGPPEAEAGGGAEGTVPEQPPLSAANLRPESLAQLRGIDPAMAFDIENFAMRQRREERELSAWEREARAKEADSMGKWWGTLETHGKAIRQVYDDTLASGDPNDPQAMFKARAAAQMAYESRKESLQDVAKALGVPMPDFFTPEEFKPEFFVQFGQARQKLERDAYMMRLPPAEPGGAPRDVAFAGTPEELQAEAARKGATSVWKPGTGPVEKPTPHTDLGKLTADYKAGLLNADSGENERIYQEQLGKVNLSGMSPEKLRQLAEEQGDNYFTASKEYVAARDAWGRIIASAEDPSAAGDLALIFNFMKVLDPTSTVRESEFKSAARAGDYGERIQAFVNNALQGTLLTETQRADFVKRAKGLMGSMQATQEARRKAFSRIATRAKIDPADIMDRVVSDALEAPEQNQAGGAGRTGGGETAGLPRFGSVAEVQQAVAAGKLKKGDRFLDVNGDERVVP